MFDQKDETFKNQTNNAKISMKITWILDPVAIKAVDK